MAKKPTDEFTRKELEAQAEREGLENPQQYANKAELVAALNTLREGQDHIVDGVNEAKAPDTSDDAAPEDTVDSAEVSSDESAVVDPGQDETASVPLDGGYRVHLLSDGLVSAPSRSRAGISVPSGSDGYVGPLTQDQLDAIKADAYLTVEPLEAEKA